MTNSVFGEGYIDSLLQIDTGIEVFDIELANMDVYTFKTPSIQNVYNDFVEVNEVLRGEIIRKYSTGEFGFYQMQGIIKSYKNFIYHNNKFFQYLSIKDSGVSGKEIDRAILSSYKNTRIHFTRMKSIIARSY